MRFTWIAALLPFLIQPAIAADRMEIHEWGTFTSLQDESGTAVGGIDEDVEPLPAFVHNIDRSAAAIWGKGVGSASHPEVTMRLETPVVYFHPPSGWSGSLSYSASFNGGLLTQFYPDAQTNVKEGQIPKITSQVVGTLNWPSITLGSSNVGPKTDSHVWLAPRDVDAAEVSVGKDENERFLFYRGIGHVDAPVKIVRDSDGSRLKLVSNFFLPMSMVGPVKSVGAGFNKVWYVDVRADGSCAFQSVGPLAGGLPGDVMGSIDTKMGDAAYSVENLKKLRSDMRPELIAAGLFADEADAMLNTWENAYFKSPGTRVFFVAPKNWTEQVLPVRCSVEAEISRVMVGRVDLITPRDRVVLEKLAEGSGNAKNAEVAGMLNELGRFAKPMLKDQMAHHPSGALEKLVSVLAE